MLTEMQRRFVEVAARTIFEHRAASVPVPAHWSGCEETWRRMEQCIGVQPYDRERASYLLGRLEGINGLTVDAISDAACDVATCGFQPHHLTHACQGTYEPESLFRAVTLEAIGQGSVRETFGEIVLPWRPRVGAACGAVDPQTGTVCVVTPHRLEVRHIGCGITWHGAVGSPLIIPRIAVEGAEK